MPKPDFPEDPIEYQQAWSQTVGELSMIKKDIARLEDRAANYFIRREDESAQALREMATIFSREKDSLSNTVSEYIKEAHRRDEEIRRVQPGYPAKFSIKLTERP